MEQELLTIPEHLSSPRFLEGFMLPRVNLVLCVMLCRSMFVLFLLAIVLSFLLRFTASDYPFGIFKFWPLCCILSARLWVCFIDRCLSFFFWPLCCSSFFDLRILITPLVSSSSLSSTALHIQLKKRPTTTKTITLHLVVSVWEQSCKSSFNYIYAFLQIFLFITWLDTK